MLALLDALDTLGADYWLDGGWGVDCLLGEQTRPHSDLDLVLPRGDLDRVSALLESCGFTVMRDWLPTTLAFRDQRGREVDLHVIDPTEDGGGDQVLDDGSGTWHYGAPVDGSLLGRSVRCCSAGEQVLMHTGYEPRPVDAHDLHRLRRRFGVRLPPPFDEVEDS